MLNDLLSLFTPFMSPVELTMNSPKYDLQSLTQLLTQNAYPELVKGHISVNVGGIRAYGQVRWSGIDDIRIRCCKDVLKWPEPVVLGLLAHELSHPALGQKASEMSTDNDVIKRGLGHYLAAERAFVGKYEDHRLARGKDMYLGFQTIHDLLNLHEQKLLRYLLDDFNITQSESGSRIFRRFHDTAIYESSSHTLLRVEGHIVETPSLDLEADIKFLFREGQLLIYADDEVVSCINWDDS